MPIQNLEGMRSFDSNAIRDSYTIVLSSKIQNTFFKNLSVAS